MITYSTELAAASQYNISSNTLIVDLPFINSVPSHISNLGIGGLKTLPNSCYLTNGNADIAEVRQGQGTILLNPLKNETGSITYLQSTNKYYMWSSSAWQQLAALTTGIPNFSSGLTASGIYVTSPGNIFLNGCNIATTGTASFERITTSYASLGTVTSGTWNGTTIAVANGGTGKTTLDANQLLLGNGTNGITSINNAAIGSVLISQGTSTAPVFSNALYLSGAIQTVGTASFGATTVSGLKSNGIISGSSTLNIVDTGVFGGVVTANAGFSSTGVSNLATVTASAGLSGSLVRAGTGFTTSGYAYIQGAASVQGTLGVTGISTLGIINATSLNASGTVSATTGISSSGYLAIGGNTQLGNANSDTTSVFGTLNLKNGSSYSGSIYADDSGNLILDGSGVSSGVQITDGVLWLGASGSTGIQISSGSYGGSSYYGGMISSSMKVVALHGFANRTSDGAASFEVDTEGHLECRSLKETSLRQYKHEIHYITESQLLNISKLKPVTFLYNQDVPQDVNDTRIRQAGFIAEQVQQIYPEVAWYKEGKLAGLQYQRLTAYLTRGIQELAEQNKLLKSRVQSLEQLVNGILQGAK